MNCVYNTISKLDGHNLFQYFHFYTCILYPFQQLLKNSQQALATNKSNQQDSSESDDNDKCKGEDDKCEGDGEKETEPSFIMGGN